MIDVVTETLVNLKEPRRIPLPAKGVPSAPQQSGGSSRMASSRGPGSAVDG